MDWQWEVVTTASTSWSYPDFPALKAWFFFFLLFLQLLYAWISPTPSLDLSSLLIQIQVDSSIQVLILRNDKMTPLSKLVSLALSPPPKSLKNVNPSAHSAAYMPIWELHRLVIVNTMNGWHSEILMTFNNKLWA